MVLAPAPAPALTLTPTLGPMALDLALTLALAYLGSGPRPCQSRRCLLGRLGGEAPGRHLVAWLHPFEMRAQAAQTCTRTSARAGAAEARESPRSGALPGTP